MARTRHSSASHSRFSARPPAIACTASLKWAVIRSRTSACSAATLLDGRELPQSLPQTERVVEPVPNLGALTTAGDRRQALVQIVDVPADAVADLAVHVELAFEMEIEGGPGDTRSRGDVLDSGRGKGGVAKRRDSGIDKAGPGELLLCSGVLPSVPSVTTDDGLYDDGSVRLTQCQSRSTLRLKAPIRPCGDGVGGVQGAGRTGGSAPVTTRPTGETM